MLVTLDGRPVETPCGADSTLQALLDQVRATQPPDRLIVSVAVNGRELGDDDLSNDLSCPVDAGAQIDLETGDRKELIDSALRRVAEEFAAAEPRHGAIAERLSSLDAAAAVREVGEIVGLWQICHRALAQCSELLGDDLVQRLHEGRPVQAWLDDVVAKLVEMGAALEARDMVSLADLLRYELAPLCPAWCALLNGLADQLRDAGPPA